MWQSLNAWERQKQIKIVLKINFSKFLHTFCIVYFIPPFCYLEYKK
jgi:hypothetical protein